METDVDNPRVQVNAERPSNAPTGTPARAAPGVVAPSIQAGPVPDVSQAELDARCIRAVLAGDRERFSELIERYQAAVCAAVRGYIANAHTAEDVAQDVFVSAFTSLQQLRDPKFFFPWLLQIARHRAALAGKRLDQDRGKSLENVNPAAPAAPDPENSEQQRLQTVFAAVEQLAEPYRQTVLLKYQTNLTCKEIAEQEGVAVGTITSRLTRALLILRGALGD